MNSSAHWQRRGRAAFSRLAGPGSHFGSPARTVAETADLSHANAALWQETAMVSAPWPPPSGAALSQEQPPANPALVPLGQ